jgi:hypothetical protein
MGMARSLRSLWRVVALFLVLAGWVLAATSARATGSAGSSTAIRFAATKSFKTGASPQQVAFADFDGNGTVDLLTANQGTHTLSLHRGRGDGTFRKAVPIRAGIVHPLAIATADMNGDGDPDAVLVNGLRPSRVVVLLGNGAGRFSRSTFRGGHRSQWVITADLNGDGIPTWRRRTRAVASR